MGKLLHRVRFWLDHRWAPPHMSGYLDTELRPRRARRMEGHVAECDECRRLLAGLRTMLEALHALPAAAGGAGPAQISASVRARLGEGAR